MRKEYPPEVIEMAKPIDFNAEGKLRVVLDKFLKEMVQVGAVANVIVEDHGTPDTDGRYTPLIQTMVADERRRQIEKWGPQHETPPIWMVILMEEVGEAADELDLADVDDIDLRNLVQSIGSLGAACKAYLSMKFGW